MSRFRLHDILAPLSGGIALIVFVYGLIQKFFIFPWILMQSGWDISPYSMALRKQVASGRIFAIFPLPTLYAMVCGLLLICVTHYFFKASGWRKGYWAVLFLLGGANLFFTQSFGGIIFFTVGVLFYLFVSGIFKIKYLAPLLMVLALLFSLVVAMRFSEARELKPITLRFANWLQAGRVIATAPLLGTGLGNYETAVPAQVYPGEPASIYAHNFFLQLTAEIGVPWLLLLLLLAVPWLKNNCRKILLRENALFTALCILILFFNLFDVGNYFFAAGIGFAVAFSQLFDLSGRTRWLYFWPVAVLAVVLLVNEIGIDRQKTADLWLVRKELDKAERGYRRALRINPYSYRAWQGLAVIAQKKGDSAAAERIYGKILAIYPGQAYANFMFSQAAFRREAYLTALVYARRAAEANKKNHEYQRWHEFIKTHLADRLPLSGN
ncbi:MAG: O-antigen ligase family protein [Candidatus Aminicenantes bacterium]|nr:O-antigen ligase family protein [Candidatus Aminicenantes bacterium]